MVYFVLTRRKITAEEEQFGHDDARVVLDDIGGVIICLDSDWPWNVWQSTIDEQLKHSDAVIESWLTAMGYNGSELKVKFSVEEM